MKICNVCKQEKDFSFFHLDKSKKDGFFSICKICKKEKDKIYQQNKKDTNKTQWRINFPERKKAHLRVYQALKKGTLSKQPCFICGEKAEAHHCDYSRPLDVVWLCSPHHRQAHKNI